MVHGFSFKVQVGYLEHPFGCKELSFISIGITATNALSKWLQLLRQSKKIFTNTGHIGLRVCIEARKMKRTDNTKKGQTKRGKKSPNNKIQ